MFPLVSWAQFDLASSSHTDITCNNIDEGVTNDGTITLNFDGASSARGKTVVWWKFNGTAFVALAGGDVPTQINNPLVVVMLVPPLFRLETLG